MASLVLTPNAGASALTLVPGTTIRLARETSVENLIPAPLFEETYADSSQTNGAKRIRSRPTNPTGSGKVTISGTSSADLWANVQTWEETVEAVRENGGVLAYTPTGGSAVSFDLESMRITSLPQDDVLFSAAIATSEFEFVCLPFGRLASVSALAATATTDPVHAFSIAAIDGSAPALAEMTVLDSATQSRAHVEYGIETPATSATVLLDSANFVTSGFYNAGAVAVTGFHGGGSNGLRAQLTTSPLAHFGTGTQAHVGTWRVKLRALCSATTGRAYVRLSWRVGGGAFTRNAWVAFPQLGPPYELDLGMIDIPAVDSGTQGWEGWIEGYALIGGETVDFDFLAFIPAKRSGRIRTASVGEIPTTPVAADDFSSTGALTGKTPDVGAAWAAVTSSDPTDFTVTSNLRAQRTEVSDALLERGRMVRLGSTSYTAIAVQARDTGEHPGFTIDGQQLDGVFAREVDINNYIIMSRYLDTDDKLIHVDKVIGGAYTNLANVPDSLPSSPLWMRLQVNTDGTWIGYYTYATPPVWGAAAKMSGYDAALATGGSLATGGIGIYDVNTSTGAITRALDDFQAFVPAMRYVVNSGKSMKVNHERAITEPTSGTVWNPSVLEGRYMEIPPGQASRLIVKARRTDVEAGADLGIADSTTYSLSVTPRVLVE